MAGLLALLLASCGNSGGPVWGACDPAHCSSNGQCLTTGNLTYCTCNPGYAGLFCEQCAAGYAGYPLCAITSGAGPSSSTGPSSSAGPTSSTGPCAGVSCNDHGRCAAGACTCDAGYAGASCGQCAAGYSGYPLCAITSAGACAGVTCSGHGTCAAGACTCDAGYAGTSCGQCAAGHSGYPSCVEKCPPGLGTATASGTIGGQPVAVATSRAFTFKPSAAYTLNGLGLGPAGWSATCSSLPMASQPPALGFWLCTATTGTHQVPTSCGGGLDSYAITDSGTKASSATVTITRYDTTCGGRVQGSFSATFGGSVVTGSFDATACGTVSSSCGVSQCNGHGTCGAGGCKCHGGYAGASCDRCAAGYLGYPNCLPSTSPCAGVTCSGHGKCWNNGDCLCDVGYGGSSCEKCAGGFTGYPTCVGAGTVGSFCTASQPCASGLECYFDDTSMYDFGYCTKQCYSSGAACSGGPPATEYTCTTTGSSGLDPKWCIFWCWNDKPCPPGLVCRNWTCEAP